MQPCTDSVPQTGVCGSIPDGLSVYGIPSNSTALQLHNQLNVSVTALVKPDLLTSLSSPCSGKFCTLNLPCCAWRTLSCCAPALQKSSADAPLTPWPTSPLGACCPNPALLWPAVPQGGGSLLLTPSRFVQEHLIRLLFLAYMS